MYPSKVEINGDNSRVVIVPDSEHGLFLMEKGVGFTVEACIGRSAIVPHVRLEDARAIEDGDHSKLDNYVQHTSSETGLIKAALGTEIWLRRERDGTGSISGVGHVGRYINEYSPNPGPKTN